MKLTQEQKAAAAALAQTEVVDAILTPEQASELEKADAPVETATQRLDRERRERREAMNRPGSEVPDNKFFKMYQDELGYTLSEFRTDDREEAKAEAVRLKAEGFQAAYAPMKFGKFGVFFKEAEARTPRAKGKSVEARVAAEIKNGNTELEALWLKVMSLLPAEVEETEATN